MPKKRQPVNYWDSEVFPLVNNRHVIGKLENGKSPYKPTLSATKQAELETKARREAPPRHCLTCGKVLVKRVRVQINRKDQTVYMASVEYGYNGKGYWDTRECMKQSAPKLADALIQILKTPRDAANPDGLRWKAQQALNHFNVNFPDSTRQQ